MIRWSEVPEFNGRYKISDHGEVCRTISFAGRNIIKPSLMPNGYLAIKLRRPGYRLQTYLHILVAKAFVSGCTDEYNEVNHKDGNKQNCYYDNLEWVNRSMNNMHKNRVLRSYWNKRTYILIDPAGKEIYTKNLAEFCEIYGLSSSSLSSVMSGKRSHHKGWRGIRLESS